MKHLLWPVLALAGFAAMEWSYLAYQRIDPSAPWAYGLMIVPLEDAGEKPPPAPPEALVADARWLPLDAFDRELADAAPSLGLSRSKLMLSWAEKLILLSPQQAGIGDDMLAEGRFPVPGQDEAVEVILMSR